MEPSYIEFRKGYKYQMDHQRSNPSVVEIDGVLWWECRLNYSYPDCDHEWVRIRNWDNFSHMLIRDHYAWDGPSGPTCDTLNSMRASAVHDGGWQLVAAGALSERYRKPFDKELKIMLKEDRMFALRRFFWYPSVRYVGKNWVKLFGTKSELHRAPKPRKEKSDS